MLQEPTERLKMVKTMVESPMGFLWIFPSFSPGLPDGVEIVHIVLDNASEPVKPRSGEIPWKPDVPEKIMWVKQCHTPTITQGKSPFVAWWYVETFPSHGWFMALF
jgi:hypothetical protein